MKRKSEIITLDDSSDSEDETAINIPIRHARATASIISETPLNLSALQPQPVVRLKPLSVVLPRLSSVQRSAVAVPPTATVQMRPKPAVGPSPPKKLHLISRDDAAACSTLNSHCYESYDPKAPPFERQQYDVKFRCSIATCQLLLLNNTSLVFHTWSHAAQFSTNEGLSFEREMHRFVACPQCLHIFPSPYRLQIHYTNVHSLKQSASVCKTCEITVDEKKHRNVHGSFDAPFHCKKCRFRTSIRTHLIDHFVRFHSNTRSLLCPYCLLIIVPKEDNSSEICTYQYTRHILQHLNGEQQYRCKQCSLIFLRKTEKIAHRRDHSQPNPKWISKRVQIHTRRVGRKLWSIKDKHTCLECNETFRNLRQHFKSTYYCTDCPYQTNCATAFQRHKFVSCKKERGGMTRSRLLPCIVVCSRCKRSSCVEKDILDHLLECSGGSCTIVDRKEEAEEPVSHQREQLEEKIFAHRWQADEKQIDTSLKIQPIEKPFTQSVVKARTELNIALSQSLRKICPPPRYSFADILQNSPLTPADLEISA